MWIEFGKLLLQALSLILIVTAGIAWPGWYWAKQAGIEAIGWAALVGLLGSFCSLIPVVIARYKKSTWLVQACLGATMIRMVLTGIFAWIIYLLVLERENRLVFALAVLVLYLALLIWETFIVLKSIRVIYPGVKKESLVPTNEHDVA